MFISDFIKCMVDLNQPYTLNDIPPRNNKHENIDIEDYFELKVT